MADPFRRRCKPGNCLAAKQAGKIVTGCADLRTMKVDLSDLNAFPAVAGDGISRSRSGGNREKRDGYSAIDMGIMIRTVGQIVGSSSTPLKSSWAHWSRQSSPNTGICAAHAVGAALDICEAVR
jgi:hypothetical protein